jgi:hypothetical protein
MTKNEKVIAGILVGGAIIGIYMHYQKMKRDKDKAKASATSIIKDTTILEKTKFTPAFNEDFDIVLSTAKQLPAVKAKSRELTASRYAIKPQNIKPPVRL